ncbi:MAG: hypothetical protein LBE21_10895, partial [Pseudomonadales bacterium]|nr:hypothetical protein [Pseudomonadales bacterium]
MTSPLSDPRKLRLLHELGISVYLPRYQPPGAAPSLVRPWPPARQELPPPPKIVESFVEKDAPPVWESPPPMEAESRAQMPVVARRTVKIEDEAPAAPREIPPPRTVAAAAEETEIRFQTLLFPVSKELAVLALLPALARRQLQDRERLLLQNILRWLGLVDPNLREARPFQWPLPNLPGGGLQLAGASLHAFLDQARREEKFARLLIFGGLPH